MKIIGIDPGSTLMGFGVLTSDKENLSVVEYGVLKIRAKNLPDKLLELSSGLQELLRKHKPDIAGLEKLFFSKNKKTAFEVAQARGVIVLEVLRSRAELIELTPAEVKIAVANYGLADKLAVQKMVQKILNIKEFTEDDNAADALAVAIAAASQKRY